MKSRSALGLVEFIFIILEGVFNSCDLGGISKESSCWEAPTSSLSLEIDDSAVTGEKTVIAQEINESQNLTLGKLKKKESYKYSKQIATIAIKDGVNTGRLEIQKLKGERG